MNRRGPPPLPRAEMGIHGLKQMDRKMLRNVEIRGVHAAGNGPSSDRKCWQRLELGIHGLNRWTVKCLEMSRKRGVHTAGNAPSEDRRAGNALKGLEARRPPLPGARWPSRRLTEAEWATHPLAPGKRGWPPTSNHHVALATCHPPYPTPTSATRNWVRLACVRCYDMLRFCPTFWAILPPFCHPVGFSATSRQRAKKAPPALGGSAMVARPTRPHIFAVN